MNSIVALIGECTQKRSREDKDTAVIISMKKACEGYDCATMLKIIISAISAVQQTTTLLPSRTVVRLVAEVWAHHLFKTEELEQWKNGTIQVEGDESLRSITASWINKAVRKEKESKEKNAESEQEIKEKEAKSISFCLDKHCCVTKILTPGSFLATPSLEVGDTIIKFEGMSVFKRQTESVLFELQSEVCSKVFQVVVQRQSGRPSGQMSIRPTFHNVVLERFREFNCAADWGSDWGADSGSEVQDLLDDSESAGEETIHDKAATGGVSHSNVVCGMSIYNI